MLRLLPKIPLFYYLPGSFNLISQYSLDTAWPVALTVVAIFNTRFVDFSLCPNESDCLPAPPAPADTPPPPGNLSDV